MAHRDEQCKTCGYGATPLWVPDGYQTLEDGTRILGRATRTHAEYLVAKQRMLGARGHDASVGYRAHYHEIAGKRAADELVRETERLGLYAVQS